MQSQGEIDQSKMTMKSLLSETLKRPLQVTVTEPIAIALNVYLVRLRLNSYASYVVINERNPLHSRSATRCSTPGVSLCHFTYEANTS
jgi:hypothetical protein